MSLKMFYKRNIKKNECISKLNFLFHTGLLVCLGVFSCLKMIFKQTWTTLYITLSVWTRFICPMKCVLSEHSLPFLNMVESRIRKQFSFFPVLKAMIFFSEVKQCFFKFPVLDVSSIDESSLLCWNSEYKNCPSLWKLLKGMLYFFHR